jgi:hypothetical protein
LLVVKSAAYAVTENNEAINKLTLAFLNITNTLVKIYMLQI